MLRSTSISFLTVALIRGRSADIQGIVDQIAKRAGAEPGNMETELLAAEQLDDQMAGIN